MVEYLQDIEVTEDKDVRVDSSNDLALVSGADNLEQSVALSVLDVTSELVGEGLRGEQLAILEQRVEQALRGDPHVGSIQRIRVERFDAESGTVTIEATVRDNDDFTVDLTV